MTHEDKIAWMAVWAARNNFQLQLAGEVGFGRECVGIVYDGAYPDYAWYDKDFNQVDNNGEVWKPEDAYHKHECVAVLGRGEAAEAQLYEWLRWFDANGFVLETGSLEMDPNLGMIGVLFGKHRYVRLVRKV